YRGGNHPRSQAIYAAPTGQLPSLRPVLSIRRFSNMIGVRDGRNVDICLTSGGLAMTRSRALGYVQASANADVETADAQEQIIHCYTQRLGRGIDAMYVDRVSSECRPLIDRAAGKQLMLDLRRGDHVIAARLDRLDASLKGFTRVLDAWSKLGV